MNLPQIPPGSRVLVDSNIFIYSANQSSKQCLDFFERCRKRILEGVITTLTLAECCHRWMMREAVDKKLITKTNPAKSLAAKPEIVKVLTDYASRVNGLIHGTLEIKTIETEDFIAALQHQRRWGLLSNDSLQLAVAERLGIDGLATADKNFDSVLEMNVYKPSDLAGC